MWLRAALAAFLGVTAVAQSKNDPVQWQLTPASGAPGAAVILKLKATMAEPWHLYSATTPKGGPIVTTVALQPSPAIARYQLFQAKPDRKMDPNFGIETETFEKETVFLFRVELAKEAAAGAVDVAAQVRYQACTDKLCLPPKKKTITGTLTVNAAIKAEAQIPAGYSEVAVAAAAAPAGGDAKPKAFGSQDANQPLGPYLLTAFGVGIAALFTPCVFPMIPFIMSYFLGRGETSRGQALGQAALFCVGVIVLFCLLGFGVTALAGPFGVVQLSSSPWVNGFIAVLFFVFGLSLLGAFELTLPSGLLTKVDNASRQGGAVGTLLMGLSFSLSSFACVGPFVGALLAGSVQNKGVQPALGMLSFATGLASPFFLLALFPSFLKKMPKSGGWLGRVKVVMGFVLLAAMLKYVSNIDQVMQWGLLSRELFLAGWFVFLTLAGLYLLGLLRLEGIGPNDHLGVGRLLVAAVFLITAVWLVPGMFGAKLGELEAYVPTASGSPLGGAAEAGKNVWIKNDLEKALAQAKAENKRVLINFTGYTCTNCHWMKQNMFPRPPIQEALNDLVLVELYTDGTDAASEKNQKLQETRFQTVAIPFYAVLSADDQVLASFAGLTKNADEFLAFLKTGSRS
jgi:thiol:disulfide interchange protein DsbD